DNIIQSQYLGDLADYESYLAYKRTYEDIRRIYEFHPEIYVSDLHPSYLSTKFAEEIAGSQNLFKVQHHKAHIASVCIENNIFEPVIGIALDGTGYGEDGMIWGGEVFLGDLKEGFERRGHLSYTPFPFGDLAVKEPERSYLCYLTSMAQNDESLYNIFSEATAANLKTLTKIISETKIFTSSTGRLFDCVSYLLGFRKKVSFEGEPAIELENLIYRKFSVEDDIGSYDFAIKADKGNYIIDVKTILYGVFEDYIRKIDNEIISVKFHSTIVSAFSEVVFKLSKDFGIKKIALSGGSFQNSYLLYNFLKKLHFSGLSPYINRYSPPNDACISIGQCALLSIS
ncbi:MAG: carbamoyltransferase HypF, partial [Proteobacteria bacterium]|nr:carbamoyltransferase HypF [Pseudomonadota bacterium]